MIYAFANTSKNRSINFQGLINTAMAFGQKYKLSLKEHLFATFAVTYLFVLADVTDGAIVDTDPRALLEMGSRAELPCRVEIAIYSVTWYKLTPESVLSLILFMDLFADPGFKDGPGYEDGSFDIDGNYSLIFNQVDVSDEGAYFCEVADLNTGGRFRNGSDVSVFASPEEPFPTIAECNETNVTMATQTELNCTLTAYSANITCFVNGYYPNITLSFIHGNIEVNNTVTYETANSDDTFNKSIVATVSASDEPYTCVAADVPGYLGNRIAEVIIQPPPPPSPTDGPGSSGPNLAAIITPTVLVTTFMVVPSVIKFVYFVNRERREAVNSIMLAALIFIPLVFVIWCFHMNRTSTDQVRGNTETSTGMPLDQLGTDLEGAGGSEQQAEHGGPSDLLGYTEISQENKAFDPSDIEQIVYGLSKRIQELEGEVKTLKTNEKDNRSKIDKLEHEINTLNAEKDKMEKVRRTLTGDEKNLNQVVKLHKNEDHDKLPQLEQVQSEEEETIKHDQEQLAQQVRALSSND